jgi:hypothetical protein
MSGYRRYFDKALLQREVMCFTALMTAAGPETNLRPVLNEFSMLLSLKLSERGLQVDIDELASFSVEDVREMLADPFAWGQAWLAEFRNDPNDNFMVVMFADHCQRQFNAFKHAIATVQTKG